MSEGDDKDIEFDFGLPLEPEAFKVWVAAQPPEVREAALLFPPGKAIHIRDVTYWVVGYSPEGALVAIKNDPATLTPEAFERLVSSGADLLDPHAIIEISTRH